MSIVAVFLLFLHSITAYPHLGIIGGKNATDGQFPYQVSIQPCGPDYCYNLCGGLIIGSKWILTAAHCYDSALHYKVFAGTKKLSLKDAYTQIVNVKTFHVHDEKWAREPSDIALVELQRPLTYNPRVQPIVLPEQGFETSGLGYASGWGLIDIDQDGNTDDLQWLEMYMLSEKECKTALDNGSGKQKFYTDKNVCAVASLPNSTLCYGDSGSGIVQDGRVIGIVSWGPEDCALNEYPTVFTKVSNYISWIYSIVGTL